jgi:hypothetical protein
MTNCCDDYGNCTQGRDCPVRKERIERVAKVAKARPVMMAAKPLGPSIWARHCKALAKWFLLMFLAWMICLPLLYFVAII